MARQPIGRLHDDLVLTLETPTGRTRLTVSVEYDASDPYAVALVFHPATGPVRWLVARDLLLDGLTGPAGIGDVHVWPEVPVAGDAEVVVQLTAPDGRLEARAPLGPLHRFLTRTLVAVPRGTESRLLDLDSLADALVGGPGSDVEQ